MSNQALLDEAGVLVGFSDKEGARGIPVPADCDLQPGAYRWDAEAGTFMPILEDDPTTEPAALRAIALALMAIRDGRELPRATLEWLEAYEASFDLRDSVD